MLARRDGKSERQNAPPSSSIENTSSFDDLLEGWQIEALAHTQLQTGLKPDTIIRAALTAFFQQIAAAPEIVESALKDAVLEQLSSGVQVEKEVEHG